MVFPDTAFKILLCGKAPDVIHQESDRWQRRIWLVSIINEQRQKHNTEAGGASGRTFICKVQAAAKQFPSH